MIKNHIKNAYNSDDDLRKELDLEAWDQASDEA